MKIPGGRAEFEQGESVGRGLDDGRWVGVGVSHSILGSFRAVPGVWEGLEWPVFERASS